MECDTTIIVSSTNISKNNILSELDRKVKHLLLYKKKIHRDSTCSKILDMLYSSAQFTVSQIACDINKPRHYTKKIVLQMYSDGYLLHDEKKRYNRKYFLSDMGRWFAVCVKLDYISFQSLCILSQTYCKVKKHPNNKTGCYMISKFRDAFDMSCDDNRICASAVYTTRNISHSIKMLTDRNLLYWANKDFLSITFGVFTHLQKHDRDFTSLVDWQNKIFEECKNEQFKTVMNTSEKKMLFSSIGRINRNERTTLTS